MRCGLPAQWPSAWVRPAFSRRPDAPTLTAVTSPVRLRAALDAVPAYRAGRPAPPGAYKISSNENPYPPLPSVRKVLEDAAGSVNRYPDFTSSALVGALAQRFDVPPDCLAVGTGSVGVLQQALQSVVDPGDEVVFAWRSFEAYPIITQSSAGVRAGAAAPRRDATTSTRWQRPSRPHPARRCVHAQQPDGHRGPGGRRSTGSSSRAVRRAGHPGRGVPRVRPGRRDPRRPPLALPPQRGSPPYVLQGLRPRRASGRLRRGAPPGHEALRKTAVPFGVPPSPKDAAVASLGAEAELLERVDALVASGPASWLRYGPRAGRCRTRRPTSSGCVPAPVPPRWRRRARRPASSYAPSTARASG